MFGTEAYPSLHEKAAALLHSLARNHGLVDGNERTAWAACHAMPLMNDVRVERPSAVEVGEFVLSVARGEADVPEIAQQLVKWASS